MSVVRCGATGTVKKAFTIPGQDQPADIDVTSDGSAVLLTDTNGKFWRWDGSGNPSRLNTSLPLDPGDVVISLPSLGRPKLEVVTTSRDDREQGFGCPRSSHPITS